ncbi:MAG TPA: HEPN domain-containing protein [Candidatus Thermoplasmatota archaeon]|nr:HEPN domain-containing protein [Candidatus Thermoplasmatota archaeon]
MRRDAASNATRWLAQATRDLDDALFAAQGKRWSLACFLAQQAAEKAVKAFLYGRGRELVLGHSVDELLLEAASFDKAFEPMRPDGSKLDRMYVPTRYPDALPGGLPFEAFHEDDAATALAAARRIIDAVAARVKKG